MRKSDLINEVFNRSSVSKKQCEEVVSSLFDVILETLSKGEEVSITGFGNFICKESQERNIIDYQTKENIKLAKKKNIKFQLSKTVKKNLNK